jgi:GntR family transcriptional regulator of abcA and norABC
MQIDYGTSSLSQMVVQKLISSGYYEENLNRLRERLKDKRDKMLTILESDFFDIADWNVPSGGFYIWLTIKKKIELKKVFEGCIKEGVIINPGYMYDKNNKNAIRLSFSYINEKEMIDGLEVLKNIILKSLKEDSHNAKV